MLVMTCVACGSADGVSKHILLRADTPPLLSAAVGSALRFCFQLPMNLLCSRISSSKQFLGAVTLLLGHAKLHACLALILEVVAGFTYSLANSYSSQPAVVAVLVGSSYIWSALMASSVGLEPCQRRIVWASVVACVALTLIVGLPMLEIEKPIGSIQRQLAAGGGESPPMHPNHAMHLHHRPHVASNHSTHPHHGQVRVFQQSNSLPPPAAGTNPNDIIGVLLALVCGICVAGSIVTYRHATTTLSSHVSLVLPIVSPFGSLIAAGCSCIIFQIAPRSAGDAESALHRGTFWGILAFNAFLQAVYIQGLAVGTRYLTSFEVSLNVLTEFFWAPLFTLLFLGEVPSHWTLPGTILLLIVMVVFAHSGIAERSFRVK